MMNRKSENNINDKIDFFSENIQAKPKKKLSLLFKDIWFDYTEAMRTHKYLFLLWSFLLPMGIMALIYISMEVYPIGNNSVLVLDLNGQYVYFFEELRNKILSGGSLLYSWSRSLGGEFMGIFAYYIASPFSFIVCLFPKKHITEALLTIILLKTGSCGLTMSIFLRKVYPSRNFNTVIFSTLYAVSSYAVVQAHNTMWIDELIFLPLLCLGIRELVSKKKFILYTVVLALSAMSNFYIGYMMCIFTILYFFYYYVSASANGENNFYGEGYHFVKSLVRILLFSLLALAIALVVLYPAYYSLKFGKNDFTDPNFELSSKFDLLDIIAKLFPGSYDTVRPEGLPFIYCGTLTLIMLPFYFFSKKIRAREKIAGGILMLCILFSFSATTIDMVWHGFQNPNWLNCRYSFMFIFLMVSFAYKAFDGLKTIGYRDIAIVCAGLVLILAVLQKQEYEWLDDITCIWLSAACIVVYLGLLYIVRRGWLRYGALLLLTAAVSLELFVSGITNEIDLDDDVVYSSRTSYVGYMNKLQPAVDALKQYDSDNFGSLFYRMEKTSHRKTNDAMALGMYGISNSTSTLNASVIELLQQLGFSSKSHWTKYLGGTPVSDSLLGIKYLIYSETDESNEYEKIYADEENELYGFYNPYALSLAYAVNEDTAAISFADNGVSRSPFERMNALVAAMLGEDEPIEIFKPIEDVKLTYENVDYSYTSTHRKYTPTSQAKTAKIMWSFYGAGENEIFCYFPSDYKRDVAISLNGEDYGTYFENETYRILSLGSYEEDFEVMFSMTMKDSTLYIATGAEYFYYLDEELFESTMARLQENQLDITSFYDTKIEGNINITDDRTLVFTTIPYDEGWRITVDGEPVELVKTLDALTAFYAPAGEHNIVMKYSPTCFRVGASVSVIAVFTFALIIFADDRIKRKRRTQHYKAYSEALRK